jgi:hypothetical protein
MVSAAANGQGSLCYLDCACRRKLQRLFCSHSQVHGIAALTDNPLGTARPQTTCPRGIPFSVSLVSPVPSLLRRVRVEIQDAAKLRRGIGLGAHNRGADPRENIRMVDGLALGTLQSLQGPGRRLLSRWSRAVSGKGDAGREIQVRLLAVTPMPTSRHERAFPTIGRQSQPAASDLSTICSMH